MDKEDVVHIYREILLSHIKEWNKPLAPTWMQLEIIILNEVRQTRQMTYANTYIWNLKYDTNLPIYETEIESQI